MEPATQRRLGVLRGHLAGSAAAGGEVTLSPTAATSVGADWARPMGYSVALPERLPGDFNVYRCASPAKARSAQLRGCGVHAIGLLRLCADSSRRFARRAPRSNAKYPLELITGFPAPDDNITTVQGAPPALGTATRHAPAQR